MSRQFVDFEALDDQPVDIEDLAKLVARVLRELARRRDIMSAVDRVNDGSGVILLTDMFGGTPSNLGITFLEQDKIEIITGVNLPMLIKAASMKEAASLTEVARALREHGRNAIWVASDLLSSSEPAPKA